ncbi:Hypothetical protein, putative [Bodo saltans]|uniref:Uncharacterized protein n=1 Tax=Bodo saltans TaxID=75058 RepID=A0A0S4JUT9_BODSA|nr:Hypothetical protein, putative [Bodo saltans]|eukprot:CUG93803.1 Hypothetical protein, putative [Bodo saltans]
MIPLPSLHTVRLLQGAVEMTLRCTSNYLFACYQ